MGLVQAARHAMSSTQPIPSPAPPPPVSYTKDWLKTLQQTAYPDCNAHVQMAKDLGGLTATHRAAIKAAGAEHRQTTDPERQEELVSIIRSAIMDSSVKAKAMTLKYEESKMQKRAREGSETAVKGKSNKAASWQEASSRRKERPRAAATSEQEASPGRQERPCSETAND